MRSFGVAASVVAADGLGSVCTASRGFIFLVHASFILIQTNDFALDSRQEPYEVMLHVRICAGGHRNGGPYRNLTFYRGGEFAWDARVGGGWTRAAGSY